MQHNTSFRSWGDWLEACQGQPTTSARGSRQDASQSWDLNAGFDGTLKLAANGWREGMSTVRPLSHALLRRIARQLNRVEWTPDVTGHVLDVAGYVSGEPEHWYTPHYTVAPGAGQAVRVVFNATASGGVDARVLRAKGAAVCALVEAFHLADRPVRVEAVIATREGGNRSETRITIKDFRSPLDMDRLVFAISHPAMLRRLWFAFAETWTPETQQALGINWGYGMPMDVNPEGTR